MSQRKIVKLAGVKEKTPHFIIRSKEKGDKKIGNSLPMSVKGIRFAKEEYEGKASYKLKLQGQVTTSTGSVIDVLVDMGGSSLAKGFANSLLSATSSLEELTFYVYTTKDGNFGGGIIDRTLPNNGLKGKENSQNLQWGIAGEDRDKLIEKTTKKNGEVIIDDSEFLDELAKHLDTMYSQSHPFQTSQSTQLDASLFDDDLTATSQEAEDLFGTPTKNATETAPATTETHINATPF